ncbi:hypothetical protein ANT2_3932 [plant metagenome]|uniref:Uncharacterized protein n=1 Tax=plant metagenome TaxID=1297885 RepID=A0A484SPM6_9ZZZZ
MFNRYCCCHGCSYEVAFGFFHALARGQVRCAAMSPIARRNQ